MNLFATNWYVIEWKNIDCKIWLNLLRQTKQGWSLALRASRRVGRCSKYGSKVVAAGTLHIHTGFLSFLSPWASSKSIQKRETKSFATSVIDSIEPWISKDRRRESSKIFIRYLHIFIRGKIIRLRWSLLHENLRFLTRLYLSFLTRLLTLNSSILRVNAVAMPVHHHTFTF